MPAAIGNKYNVRMKTIEQKLKVYESYCAHIAEGLSKDSWFFDDDEITCCRETIEKYIKEEPEVFAPILMKQAKAKSLGVWEKLGMRLMVGEFKGGSPEVWKTFMRNKFDWDKQNTNLEADEDKQKAAIDYLTWLKSQSEVRKIEDTKTIKE